MLAESLRSNGNESIRLRATVSKSFKYAAHKAKIPPENFGKFVEELVKLLKRDDDLSIKKNCMDSLSQISYNSETKKCLQ